MKLEQKINDELKAAIKSANKLRMETLRSIRASIIEFNKSGIGREMNEDEELQILKSAIKRRKDAIEMYLQGNRDELAAKEKAELEIITEFMPKQLTEQEIKIVVDSIIADTGATGMKDMGKVMGLAMQKLKAVADGNSVQKIVKAGLEIL